MDPSEAEDIQPDLPTGPVTVTQADLSRIAAREKAQGQRAGIRKVLEETGFATTEALTAYLQTQRDAEQQSLTDQERRQREQAEREKTLQEKLDAAQHLAREMTIRSVLLQLGAYGQDQDDALALIAVPADADEAAVREAAQALKARRSELFQKPALPSAPTGAPAPGWPARPTPTPAEIGAAGLAEARRRGHVSA